MNSIPEYLLDNPDYYIDWWEEILVNREKINKNVDKILLKFNSLTFFNSVGLISKKWEILFIDKTSWSEIWKNRYIDNDAWYWFLVSSSLDKSFNKYEGYWKAIYILTAIEALKQDKIFVSDTIRNTTIDGKYTWNSLVNLWFVEFDENLNRFKFINNMLEDYFLE